MILTKKRIGNTKKMRVYRNQSLVSKNLAACLPVAGFIDSTSNKLFVLFKVESVFRCVNLAPMVNSGPNPVVNCNHLNYCGLIQKQSLSYDENMFPKTVSCMILPLLDGAGSPSSENMGYFTVIDNEWTYKFTPLMENNHPLFSPRL